MPEGLADHFGDGYAISFRPSEEEVLEVRIETDRLDTGRFPPEARASATAAPSDDRIDVEALLGLVGERLDENVGDRCARRRMAVDTPFHGSSSLR